MQEYNTNICASIEFIQKVRMNFIQIYTPVQKIHIRFTQILAKIQQERYKILCKIITHNYV